MFKFLAFAWPKSAVAIVTMSLMLPFAGQAQDATLVEGRVVSHSSGFPVAGATVILVGTLYGTVSDSAGTFSLGPVPDGEYQLRVTAPGFGAAELAFAVPSDPQIVKVRTARGRLPDNPVLGVTETSVADPYDGSATALAADSRGGLARVAGVDLATYSPVLSSAIVRALSSGRTSVHSIHAPSVVLDIPGAGRLDLTSPGRAYDRGIVVFGSLGSPLGSHESASVQHDDFDGIDGPAALQVDTGFQTNIRSATAAATYTAHSSRAAFRFAGRYARGGDYAAPDGRTMSSSFDVYGGNAAAMMRLSAVSRLFVAGSVTGVGSAELPGSVLAIASARHANVATRWEWVPEGQRLRRLTAAAAVAGSDAELGAMEVVGPSLPRADATTTAFQTAILADLALLGRELVQVGLSLRRTVYDGRLFDGFAPEGALFWPDGRTDDGHVFLATRFTGFRAAAATRVSLGYRATSEKSGSQNESIDRFLTGSLSLAYEYRPRIAWTLGAIGELLRRPPSVHELLADPTPDIDRVVVGRISGNSNLRPENWVRLSASAQRTAEGTTVEIKSFLALVGDFIGHTRISEVGPISDSTRWTYTNRTARFLGLELYARRQLAPFVSISGHVNYVDAVDLDRDETLPLVPSVGGRADFTAATPGERLLLEFSSEFALSRSSVALALGETAAKGFVIFHMRMGVPLSEHLSFRFGVYNIFNGTSAPLLNPTRSDRRRVPMPGRSWLFALRFQS